VALWDRLAAAGHTDPAEYLASVVDDQKADANLRAAAANYLMPYKYSKRGLTSEPAPLVYVEHPVTLPRATCTEVRHVVENIEFPHRGARLRQARSRCRRSAHFRPAHPWRQPDRGG
jgi:hypothetical protein